MPGAAGLKNHVQGTSEYSRRAPSATGLDYRHGPSPRTDLIIPEFASVSSVLLVQFGQDSGDLPPRLLDLTLPGAGCEGCEAEHGQECDDVQSAHLSVSIDSARVVTRWGFRCPGQRRSKGHAGNVKSCCAIYDDRG